MDYITDYIHSILITESGILLFVAALLLGYALKSVNGILDSKFFSFYSERWNQLIPAANALVCGILAVYVPEFHVGVSSVAAFVNGAAVALVASFVYDKIKDKLRT